jgi:serine/threonine-protein kinase PpkA
MADTAPAIPGYRIIKPLGQGGMATVWLAENTQGDKVALKILGAPSGVDPQWVERFMREAEFLRKLNHPNIVRVLDAGAANGTHYMAMEFLDHGDLTSWIRQGLKPEDALRILRTLAEALDFVHQRSLLHRDLKPDNVLFRADGRPVLVDFGVARTRSTDMRLTQMGMVVGTPRYMSPEQHKGQELDPRSDIYSLGIMFYEMLMKEVPFDAPDAMSIGIKHLTEPVPRLPARFSRYQRFMDAMLAKQPGERMARGEMVVKAIDLLLSQPDLAVKKSMAATAALERGVDVQEKTEKTGMFSKACDIRVAIAAEDYPQLQERGGKARDTLLEWYRETGAKKARKIELDLYLHPWILTRGRDFVRQLAANEMFAFLKQHKARVRIHNLDGEPESDFVME